MYYDLDYLFSNLLGGGLIFLFLFILFISVALIVISVIAGWKLFKKAGKHGWEAIVPFYNSFVYVEISGLDWWWFLLMLAPNIVSIVNDDLSGIASLVSLFATFNCFYNIAKKFKKDTAVSVCAGIFNFVFLLIFAFSKKEKYCKNVNVSKNGAFGKIEESKEVKNNDHSNEESSKYCVECGTKLDDYYKFCPKCGKEK